MSYSGQDPNIIVEIQLQNYALAIQVVYKMIHEIYIWYNFLKGDG